MKEMVQTGDVVVLNSGGVWMTVRSTWESVDNVKRTIVLCDWSWEGDCHQHEFPLACLTKVEPPKAKREE